MPVQIKVDNSKIGKAIEGYARKLGKTNEEMTRDMAVQTALGLIRFTQPWGSGGKAQQVGERAISRDVGRTLAGPKAGLISIATERGDGSPNGAVIISSATRKPVTLRWPNVDPDGSSAPGFHRGKRGARGRVTTPSRQSSYMRPIWDERERLVVERERREAFRKRQMEKAGAAKGGWAAALADLTGTTRGVTRWITRHIPRVGGSAQVLSPRENVTSIVLRSGAEHGGEPNVLTPQTLQRTPLAAARFVLRKYKREVDKLKL